MHAPLRRRNPAEWAIRGLIVLVAAWLGYLAVTRTLATTLAGSQLERAYQLAPGDARIAAALSEKLSQPEASADDRTRADQLAHAALQRDPTAIGAIVTLGLSALLRKDVVRARNFFTYAERLSRRSLQVQLWAIEDAVERGDIPSALKHYDIALRTKLNASAFLFPVLASAIADPTVRTALAETLARQPAWGTSFIDFAAVKADDPLTTVALFGDLRRRNVTISNGASAVVIAALLAADRLDEMWSFYRAVRGDVDRSESRDPRFTQILDEPSLLDWIVANEPGISTSIQRGNDGGIFDFSVGPSIGGVLLRQVQLLPPGDYALQGQNAGIEQPMDTLPYWSLRCRNGPELGRIVVPASADAATRFAGRFRIPAGCPVQVLSLIARPSNAVSGLVGQINRVKLRPVATR